MTRSLPPQLGSHTPVSPTRPAAGLLGDGHLPPPRGRGQVRLRAPGTGVTSLSQPTRGGVEARGCPARVTLRATAAGAPVPSRAEQLTDPVAYHGEGPVWSQRWGGLRWVDMLAGDILTLSASGVGLATRRPHRRGPATQAPGRCGHRRRAGVRAGGRGRNAHVPGPAMGYRPAADERGRLRPGRTVLRRLDGPRPPARRRGALPARS